MPPVRGDTVASHDNAPATQRGNADLRQMTLDDESGISPSRSNGRDALRHGRISRQKQETGAAASRHAGAQSKSILHHRKKARQRQELREDGTFKAVEE